MHRLRFIGSIGARSITALLKELGRANLFGSRILWICGNSRYERPLAVRQYLKTLRIQLVFLRRYAPMLKLIERLRKRFRKEGSPQPPLLDLPPIEIGLGSALARSRGPPLGIALVADEDIRFRWRVKKPNSGVRCRTAPSHRQLREGSSASSENISRGPLAEARRRAHGRLGSDSRDHLAAARYCCGVTKQRVTGLRSSYSPATPQGQAQQAQAHQHGGGRDRNRVGVVLHDVAKHAISPDCDLQFDIAP